MPLPKFEYLSPTTLQQACALLAEHQGAARLIAGGTDLLVKMKHRGLTPKYVIGLKQVTGLDVVKFDADKGLTIGAMAKLSEVAEHPDVLRHYPAVALAAQHTATVAIRNMGTVVGNLCNAAPSADNAPALLALNATAHIVGPNHERELPLDQFFQGPGITALEPEEIVKAITVPKPVGGASFKHLSGRSKVDISAVNVGVWTLMEDSVISGVRIFLGAVAPIPMRAPQAEAVILKQKADDELFKKAAETAMKESSPITDVRATAEYRRKMVAVLTEQALKEAVNMASSTKGQ